jgi:hypothetical protein
MIKRLPENWLASIMTVREKAVIVSQRLQGDGVLSEKTVEIIAEELDLVFFKNILKEMALWKKKN